MTRSTPARLYQLRSKITISPAAGKCGRYRCRYIWLLFALGRCRQRNDAKDARTDTLREGLDRAALAGPIAALEDDDDLCAGRLDPALELHELDVQLRELLFVVLARELAGRRPVAVARRAPSAPRTGFTAASRLLRRFSPLSCRSVFDRFMSTSPFVGFDGRLQVQEHALMADPRADARPFDDFENTPCHAGEPQFATVAPQFVIELLEDLERGVFDVDHRAAVDHEHLRSSALLLGPISGQRRAGHSQRTAGPRF